MIESIQFKNFKALKKTKLPLGQFTLIVGPNGSGKTTALQGIVSLWASPLSFDQVRSVGVAQTQEVIVSASWREGEGVFDVTTRWAQHAGPSNGIRAVTSGAAGLTQKVQERLSRIRFFSFDPNAIAQDVPLQPGVELQPNGQYLAVVLDRLRDQHPERFESLNEELHRWLPEFNRILFDTPSQGHRRLGLRTSEGGHRIGARELSQGTLIALALLTLAYLPEPPSVVCLEEPDHGLHPRLLRDVQDAMYRLAYPESSGEKRSAVQVIATTHNPYFLDLFREHPEEIVIAEKVGLEAKFSRLSDRTDLNEILGDAHLGDVWYSGVLGGVPAGT